MVTPAPLSEPLRGETRRDALRWLSVLTGSMAWPTSGRTSDGALSGDPYALGVASGSPSAEGFVIWTRLSGVEGLHGASEPVSWEVLEDRAGDGVVARGQVQARAALGYAVHAEPAGLAPDRWYRYRFTVGGVRSPEGRSRTLPALTATPGRFRLAYASCQRWEDGHYAAYRQMVADAPDLVLFLGDYIYEYASRRGASVVRPHTLPHIKHLDGYRQRYALYRSDPLLQGMHAACPWLVTWDDHEVENNYAGALSTLGTADFAALRLAAYQAFYEHMPIRREAVVGGLQGLLKGEALRLHQAADIGQLARIHLLDNRQYRSRPLCGQDGGQGAGAVCTRERDPERSMLGFEQEAWLWRSLAEARTQGVRWNILAQQTRFTPGDYPKGVTGHPGADSWDGYPETRQRVLDALQRTQAANPLLLGGDIHQNWVARVHADPFDVRSPVVASEFCGTSITSRHGATPEQSERLQRRNPHCLLAEAQHRGYGVVDLTPQVATVSLRVVEDVGRADSAVRTLARFRVPAGGAVQWLEGEGRDDADGMGGKTTHTFNPPRTSA